jgi:hypothetical protein
LDAIIGALTHGALGNQTRSQSRRIGS